MLPLLSLLFGLIHVSTTLNVTVYYETLCPDSVRFIANQLYPNYESFSQVIDLDFVPYGKATHEFVNNAWNFTCQHGPEECYGNMYHACVLHQNASQDVMVDFVYCSMSAPNPASYDTLYVCATQQGISWPSVQSCYENEGGQLLAGHGDRTHALNISFVPTITYGHNFDQQLQDQSLTNFTNVVCERLERDKRPSICNSGSDVSKTSVSVVIGLIAVSFSGFISL